MSYLSLHKKARFRDVAESLHLEASGCKTPTRSGSNWAAKCFHISNRSNLNLIENLFHIMRGRLKEDDLSQKIQKKSYAQFSARVAETIQKSDTHIINKTIESMGKRIRGVIKLRGGRTKYWMAVTCCYVSLQYIVLFLTLLDFYVLCKQNSTTQQGL